MKGKKISEEELNSAIRKFLQEGGIIQKLPDQKNVNSQAVGMRWNNSELGGEIQG